MKRLSDFKAFNDEQAENYLAAHMPRGLLFGKVFDPQSWIYKLLMTLSTVGKLFTGQLETFTRNLDVFQAEDLIERWETSVKIPSKYPRRDTLEGRQEAVQCKLSKIPVYNVQTQGNAPLDTTIEEYVRKMTGIEITIEFYDAESAFPIPFPISFSFAGGTKWFYYVINVPVEGSTLNNEFPIPFPVSFFEPQIPDAIQSKLDIVLDDVIPSMGDWTYVAVPTG